eukprot:gene53278-23667_t
MRKKETATGFATLAYYEIQEELDQASQGNQHIRDTMESNAERVAWECRDRMRAFKQLLTYKKEHPEKQGAMSEEMKLRMVWESEVVMSTTRRTYDVVGKKSLSVWQEEMAQKGT